jgi:carboxylate-amine ligase
MISHPPTAAELRAAFEAPGPHSVGLEEELMLLDPETLDLAPRAAEVLPLLGGDERFKLELPAAQLEIVLAPERSVGAAIRALAAARRDLAERLGEVVRPAAAGAHAFASPLGELNRGERYERIHAEYGTVAERQLVCALQIHVAVRGADRALAVYNSLRSYLPEIAALAANAPYHQGEDTGLASVRPKIAEMLPRQGVPPALESWEEYELALRWALRAGVVSEPRMWWWELRLHPLFGTLELRVPDAQTTVADAAATLAFAQALVAWLAERHDDGERLAAAPRWRIEENRWSAARHGLDGMLVDLESGERRPTRARLSELLEELEPSARRLGCHEELHGARELANANGAVRQRAVAAERGVRGTVEWIADRYLDGAAAMRFADSEPG